MANPVCKLPEAELEIMQAVWECTPPVSRADVERALGQPRRLAATTILTLLSRLVQRGALVTEKRGRSNVYWPAFSRREYLAAQGRRFLSKLCGNDLNALAVALCDSGLSQEDKEELGRLLAQGRL